MKLKWGQKTAILVEALAGTPTRSYAGRGVHHAAMLAGRVSSGGLIDLTFCYSQEWPDWVLLGTGGC